MILGFLMAGDSDSERLTPFEAERLSTVFFQVHNHNANTPAIPAFWYRVPEQKITFALASVE